MKLIQLDSISRNELQGSYDMGILLGGMINYRSDTNLISFNQNGDRLFQTIELYKSGVIDKILISSGSGMIQYPAFKEAELIKRFLERIGIPTHDIITEAISNNTFENAVQTKKILSGYYERLSEKRFLLITSASHMRRAKACFEKQDIRVIPYSTVNKEYKGPVVFNYEMILPDPLALNNWKTITHEIIGFWIYRLKGYL